MLQLRQTVEDMKQEALEKEKKMTTVHEIFANFRKIYNPLAFNLFIVCIVYEILKFLEVI